MNRPEHSASQGNARTGKLPTIKGFGLDIHPIVFMVSVGLIVPLVMISLWEPVSAQEFMLGLRGWVLSRFHGFFMISVNAFVLFCLLLVVLPVGRIRLGGADCAPEFSRVSWFAMLFAAGMGIGLMFFSVAEPVAHYTNWYGTPFNTEPWTPAAAELAMSATLFHWGMHAWAIYALVGLALAFFSFNRGQPFLLRSTLQPILGRFTRRWPGDMVDILGVLATVFGIATSLAFGAQQAAGGIGYLSGLGHGYSIQMSVVAVIGIAASISVILGVRRGIRVLSNFNMTLAGLLAMFVLAAGPTSQLLGIFGESVWLYARDILPLSNWTGREDRSWYEGWTVFYWAWWISWSPFVGMFIARISRGRTVREFVIAVLLVPTVVSIVWMSIFGGTALLQVQEGLGPLASGVGEVELAMFQMLQQLPWAGLSSVCAVALVITFFITSADSGSIVLSSISAGGQFRTPVMQRLLWVILTVLIAVVMLTLGDNESLTALQAGAISSGLPLTVILVLMAMSLMHELLKWRREAREG
jgi:BCCT family betaine/carnitine transporter